MLGILERGGLGLGRNGKIGGRVVKKISGIRGLFFSSSRKFLVWGHFPICRTRFPGLRNHGSPLLGNYDKDYIEDNACRACIKASNGKSCGSDIKMWGALIQ